MATIRIVGVGEFQPPRLHQLADALQAALKIRCEVSPVTQAADEAFDAMRQQYRSDLLLGELGTGTRGGDRVLGVTDYDLFIPVLTFVFGEALLGQSAAIISTHRLRNELYGLAADEDLLMTRLLKEALHELGHTFGLLHCHHPTCVMQASTYAELIDIKSEHFCDQCVTALPT